MAKPLSRISIISCYLLPALGIFLPNASPAQFRKALTPESAVLQYAGSTGFGSLGFGYSLFKRRGNLDFLYGYVPPAKGGKSQIASMKFGYRPLNIHIGRSLALYPLNPGAFFTYHFGAKYDFYWNSPQYAKGYYWWSSAIRAHLSLSNELRFTPANDGGKTDRAFAVYYELNTNDLYAVSWWQNRKSVRFSDIVRTGVGGRFYF